MDQRIVDRLTTGTSKCICESLEENWSAVPSVGTDEFREAKS